MGEHIMLPGRQTQGPFTNHSVAPEVSLLREVKLAAVEGSPYLKGGWDATINSHHHGY